MKKILSAIFALFFLFAAAGCDGEIAANENAARALPYSSFLPGAQWHDTEGNLIQAHGGQIQKMPVPNGEGETSSRWVWVGENKSNGHFGNDVAVYVSDDLYNWEFGGNAFRSVPSREALDSDGYFSAVYANCDEEEKDYVFACINRDTVMERPKMLYNAKTGKYVLWFHSDDSTERNSYKYDVGMAGVAVADSPFGPFRFLSRHRLSECPAGQIDCFPESKGEARDLNLFEEDGTAYVVYTSENNKTIYISKLNEEYTYLSAPPAEAEYGKDYIRLFPGSMREAPVLVKGENGRYYLMTSSTTGWMSNSARVWSASEIFGEWKIDGNPCKDKGGYRTYDTQSTCIFRADNGQWIYCGDRWNRGDLSDSRYVWLPVSFEGDKLIIRWQSEWRLF